MINKLTLRAFALALMVGFSGCDLDVTNTNEPDRDRALATADDLEYAALLEQQPFSQHDVTPPYGVVGQHGPERLRS